MLKKMIAKRVAKEAVKRAAVVAAKTEAKVVAGALLSYGTHKLIRGAMKKYPKLRFLKKVEEV